MPTSCKQLLVHVDASPRVALRLELARSLALKHEAQVAALYASTPSLYQTTYPTGTAAITAAVLLELDDEIRKRARANFDKAVAAPGPRTTWSEVSELSVLGSFAQQALYADLMVLGQHDPAAIATPGVPVDFVESVLAMSGKPALIIPYAGTPQTLGDTVVIAWKATRESARAVTAAMPLLRKARQVHVVSWEEDAISGVTGSSLDLMHYLALHQITATRSDGGAAPDKVGELLLSRAFDLGADLLVMGCYGHSRAREWVLGGASRTVLESMTLPVLMSH
jgi:nucleotide-binding universal stress UspA family protein